jgi:hypothetical protein
MNKRTLVALVVAAMTVVLLAVAGTASAAAAKQGDDASVWGQNCALINKDGTVHHLGKCQNVCKDKDVTKSKKYGSDYYCKASLRGTPIVPNDAATGPDEVMS